MEVFRLEATVIGLLAEQMNIRGRKKCREFEINRSKSKTCRKAIKRKLFHISV